MVRPNFIPRTLIGVGGVRLFNIPGVIYPEEMLNEQPETKKKNGKPIHRVPSWGITTKEASIILGGTPTAARLALHKKKVDHCLVIGRSTRRLYWRKSQVEKIASERLPEMRGENRKLITSQEAVAIMGTSRSTVQRYVKRGQLKSFNVRYIPERGGARIRTYFERAAVIKLANRLAAKRRRAEELDNRLSECESGFKKEQEND